MRTTPSRRDGFWRATDEESQRGGTYFYSSATILSKFPDSPEGRGTLWRFHFPERRRGLRVRFFGETQISIETPYGVCVFNKFAIGIAKRGYFDNLALAHRAYEPPATA
jgi:hypothetical protein